MAIFHQDTFTDTNGTALQSHTPDTGGSWTRNSGTDNATIQTNRLHPGPDNSNTDRTYLANGTPGSADYDVEADFVWLGAANAHFIALGGRMPGGGVYSGYRMGFATYGGNHWEFSKTVAGSDTIWTSQNVTPSGTYALKLMMRGDQISAWVNGGQVGTTQTDTSFTATGKGGTFAYSGQAVGTGINLDNFKVSDPVSFQKAYPVADGNVSGFSPSSGSDLFAMLDEAVADDADYVESSLSPAGDKGRVKVGVLNPPPAGTKTLRWRPWKDLAAGAQHNVVIRLYEGGTATFSSGTLRETFTRNNVPGGAGNQVTYEETVTATINDWWNLWVEWEATQV